MTKEQTKTVDTPEVATELLCKPGLPLSGKERRQLHRIRWKGLFVTVEGKQQRKLADGTIQEKFSPLGIAHRLEYRLGQRNWKQLTGWLKRANRRRAKTQARFVLLQSRQEQLGAKEGQPSDQDIQELLLLGQALHALNVKAATLDIFIEAVEEEITRRQKLWESVAKAGAPAFAKKLKHALKKG